MNSATEQLFDAALALGQHTDAVLTELLGLGRERLEEFRQRGVI